MAGFDRGERIAAFMLPSHRGEVRTRDFKQRQNLVLVFQHADCPDYQATLKALAERYPEYRELNAEVIVVLPREPDARWDEALPFPVAWDEEGATLDAYTERDAEGRPEPTVYVTDRYGEVMFARRGAHGPAIAAEVAEVLEFVERTCPECNTVAWGWGEAA